MHTYAHAIERVYTSQVFQVADRLADQGYVVAVPDMFGPSNSWPIAKFPPSSDEQSKEFMAWIDSTANREATALKVKEAQKHLKEIKGVDTFGVVGFCWGGSVALTLAGALRRCSPRVAKLTVSQHKRIVGFARFVGFWREAYRARNLTRSLHALQATTRLRRPRAATPRSSGRRRSWPRRRSSPCASCPPKTTRWRASRTS